MQRHHTAIAWVGWINFYARMEKWSPKQTWDYIHNSMQHKQLSKILLKHWTYVQFEDDFHHCAQIFGTQAPSLVSIGVTTKIATTYARSGVKSVRMLAKSCGVSKSTAARALELVRGGVAKKGGVLITADRAVNRGGIRRKPAKMTFITHKPVRTSGCMLTKPIGIVDNCGSMSTGFVEIDVGDFTQEPVKSRINTQMSVKTGFKVFERKELQIV
jgi:hypothetical protein